MATVTATEAPEKITSPPVVKRLKKRAPATPEHPENAEPIRRKSGKASDKQIRDFIELDPIVAGRALSIVKGRTGELDDLADLDEIIEIVGWGEDVGPWLDYFLSLIHDGFFGPKLYLVESACKRAAEAQEEHQKALEQIEKANAALARKQTALDKKAGTPGKTTPPRKSRTTKATAAKVTKVTKTPAKKAPAKRVTPTRKTAAPKAPAKAAAARKTTPRKAVAK